MNIESWLFGSDSAVDVAFTLCADLVRCDFHLTESQQSYVVDVTRHFFVFASFLAGVALNFVGRKTVILVGLCFYVVGH
ncbi:hypothetical protein LINPERHAP1_LOCUS8364 [Linum perenne]